ncbi:MAG TPA: hypothetical protein VFG42_03985, partial [Baekduia sp.]
RMILDRLAEELQELAVVEQRPNLDGRNMTMMLGPSKAVLAGTLDESGSAEEAEGETPNVEADAGATEAPTTPAEAAAPEAEPAADAADDEQPAAS